MEECTRQSLPYQKPFSRVLMVLDTKTGNVIAADTMPDGKEST
jgi:hypothetical protein